VSPTLTYIREAAFATVFCMLVANDVPTFFFFEPDSSGLSDAVRSCEQCRRVATKTTKTVTVDHGEAEMCVIDDDPPERSTIRECYEN
jgi:hypothetical protein